MEMLVHKKYIMRDTNKEELKKNGFRYNRFISDSEGDFYSIRFPVLKYNNVPTLNGEIIVDINTGMIKLNTYNYGTQDYYPPFYQEKCSEIYENIIYKINTAFNTMFDKVGIVKIGG